jgi:hypothetical protein
MLLSLVKLAHHVLFSSVPGELVIILIKICFFSAKLGNVEEVGSIIDVERLIKLSCVCHLLPSAVEKFLDKACKL